MTPKTPEDEAEHLPPDDEEEEEDEGLEEEDVPEPMGPPLPDAGGAAGD